MLASLDEAELQVVAEHLKGFMGTEIFEHIVSSVRGKVEEQSKQNAFREYLRSGVPESGERTVSVKEWYHTEYEGSFGEANINSSREPDRYGG